MEKEIVRFFARAEGRVQGVGFRFFVQQNATELGLVGWVRNMEGGSVTMEALGVIDRVKKGGWRVIDRSTAQSQEEKIEIMRRALLCDTYLTGANAISEDGEIVNVDGNGNRVAAMTFGPKSVIVACGMNKVVKTAEDATSRARNTAAPVNAQRFDIRTPCKTTGSCADCKSTDSICSYIVRTRLCKPAGRIKVVLIGEAIGF